MTRDGSEAGPLNVADSSSALASQLSEEQSGRLLRHICDDWTRLYTGLSPWRTLMERWERMSVMNYSDRVGKPDPNNPEPVLDVFSYQNDTLGMSEGFVDFAAAQAKDDIFGTKPWLAATPVGRHDTDLAAMISKHAQWKLGMSNIETAVNDAIRIACWGGTCFMKSRWLNETETFKRDDKPAAFSISTQQPFTAPSGDLVYDAGTLEQMEVDGNDVEWKPQMTEETMTVYDNTWTDCLDFKDVAFDSKATELNLTLTPFYSRFRMGILDVISHYKIPEKYHAELEFALVGSAEEARAENGESNTKMLTDNAFEANQQISLVEGFLRYDPLRTGSPIRIHCVFSPTLQILFKVDYLANVTPDGVLPVFPVRVGKKPRRILGIGYFEKYENQNNCVDRQMNAVTYRTKLSSNVVVGIHKEALAESQNNSFTIDSRKPVELAPDKKLSDFIEFAEFPDLNDRSVELMNEHLQMAQMRSGITSAAQGELKGVPNASTATGVNQLTSRGALLLKDPIGQITGDVEKVAGYNVDLIYANQNRDETFTWGEGEASELLNIKANDVQGLRMNVTLKLVQSQNQTKLQNAQAAIGIMASYATLPEEEKQTQRPLYVEAITSLGFNSAEDIVRPANPQPPAPPLPEVKESMNYKDAPPDIRRQMEAAAGYQPSTAATLQESPAAENQEIQPSPA